MSAQADMKITHKVYIDDSGTMQYSPDQHYDAGVPRYFILAAAIVPIADLGFISRDIDNLKIAAFGTRHVEIKSNWLRLPEERRDHYLLPCKLNDEQLDEFVDRFYALINTANLRFCAAVIDKLAMQERYRHVWYPPTAAYEVVLQRVQMEMQSAPGIADISIDDVSGKTPKGTEYKTNLARHHRDLRKRGSTLQPITFPNVAGRLTFVSSAVVNLIQVADLCAYNVFRQHIDHGEYWDPGDSNPMIYDWLERMRAKFCCGPNGQVKGWGIAKLPSGEGKPHLKTQR